jgi:nucleoside-diphosphate-sugar epimerase
MEALVKVWCGSINGDEWRDTKLSEKGRTVLVTGNLGYIGTVLVPLLRARGWEVIGLDTGFFPPDSFFSAGAGPHHQIMGDVRDIGPNDLPEVDAVVHLAALSNDPMGALDPALTEEINHAASIRMAEIAKKKGARRFIFSSSCSIYGAGASLSLTEEDPQVPQTAYARSKVATERDLASMASDDFSPVYLRNATAFGLSPSMRFDLVVSNLTGWGWVEGKVKILSDGTPWRPLVHIKDISAVMVEALEADRAKIHNEAFNVGRDSNNYQIRTIASAVRDLLPQTDIVYAGSGEPDRRDYNVSFKKLGTLREEPLVKWSIEAGVAELVGALHVRGLTAEEFSGPPAVRLKRLESLSRSGELDGTLRWSGRG